MSNVSTKTNQIVLQSRTNPLKHFPYRNSSRVQTICAILKTTAIVCKYIERIEECDNLGERNLSKDHECWVNGNDLTQQLKTVIVSINQYIERIEECGNLGEQNLSKDRYSEILHCSSTVQVYYQKLSQDNPRATFEIIISHSNRMLLHIPLKLMATSLLPLNT